MTIGWDSRECGASLNARELTREKNVDMGENILPHEGTQMTSTLSISSWVSFFILIFKFYENRAVFL